MAKKAITCPFCDGGLVRVDDRGGLDFFGQRCSRCDGKGRMTHEQFVTWAWQQADQKFGVLAGPGHRSPTAQCRFIGALMQKELLDGGPTFCTRQEAEEIAAGFLRGDFDKLAESLMTAKP